VACVFTGTLKHPVLSLVSIACEIHRVSMFCCVLSFKPTDSNYKVWGWYAINFAFVDRVVVPGEETVYSAACIFSRIDLLLLC
jgi:hypothetical protein